MAPRFTVPTIEQLERDGALDPVWSPPSNGASGVRDTRPGASLTGGQVRQLAVDSLLDPTGKKAARTADQNQRMEQRAASVPVVGGVLKPLAQFANTLASPDTKAGVVTGPINGISKLGNALGDLVQGKPVDVKDAWTISDENARRFNPFRLGVQGQGVTPSDQSGLEVGEAIGAEMVGAGILGRLQSVGRLQQAAQALKNTKAVKGLAVASKVNPKLRAGVGAATSVAEGLTSTVLATPFLDAEDGNLANLGDMFGIKLPGRVEPGDDYLTAFGKTVGVEGLAAPLALIGAGSLVKPIREGMVNGGAQWLNDLADAELAPYMPQAPAGPALPPAAAADLVDKGSKSLPAFGQTGFDYGQLEAPAAQYDSAIGRAVADQTQLDHVTRQRQRLEDMGLVQRGEGGQLEFSLDAGVDPETKIQVRQLQVQRGQLVKQANETGADVGQQLAEIDQQIGDLIQTGRAMDAMDARAAVQPELDLLDGRPELDTFLANLDELSDVELRQIHSAVWQENRADQRLTRETDIQGRLEVAQQKIAQINARAEAGELTPKGAKRLLTKARKELDGLQGELSELAAETVKPESLVGDQLQLLLPPEQMSLDISPSLGDELVGIRALQQQRGRWQQMTETLQESLRSLRDQKAPAEEIKQAAADLALLRKQLADLEAQIKAERRAISPEAQLQLTTERWRTREEAASEFGYQTPDDYRNALNTWKRDELRRLAMPESSPEVAALVKARTGRRVWQAKKQDIIDALVEISERRGRYLSPAVDVRIGDQAELPMVTNAAGVADGPLFDQPAELGVAGMSNVVDADGVEQLVPTVAYQRRGMDQQTRERLKAEILERAVRNGEVQPPFSPLPQRPTSQFDQGSFIGELLADESGQLPLAYATGAEPIYKAGGKSADALIEEMRLRFEYQALDAQAQQAAREAFMAANGWDTLTWQQRKDLGIIGRGFYTLEPYSERFRSSVNPLGAPQAARSNLPQDQLNKLEEIRGKAAKASTDAAIPEPPREARNYRQVWVDDGIGSMRPVEVDEASIPKPTREQAAAAEAAKKQKAKATKAASQKGRAAAAREKEALLKEREALLRQQQGGNC